MARDPAKHPRSSSRQRRGLCQPSAQPTAPPGWFGQRSWWLLVALACAVHVLCDLYTATQVPIPSSARSRWPAHSPVPNIMCMLAVMLASMVNLSLYHVLCDMETRYAKSWTTPRSARMLLAAPPLVLAAALWRVLVWADAHPAPIIRKARPVFTKQSVHAVERLGPTPTAVVAATRQALRARCSTCNVGLF